MKSGDLVKSKKFKSIGIIVEVFADLDANNPWVRVLFTHPTKSYQWIKMSGLKLIKKKEET